MSYNSPIVFALAKVMVKCSLIKSVTLNSCGYVCSQHSRTSYNYNANPTDSFFLGEHRHMFSLSTETGLDIFISWSHISRQL